jgi:hypothetical protein
MRERCLSTPRPRRGAARRASDVFDVHDDAIDPRHQPAALLVIFFFFLPYAAADILCWRIDVLLFAFIFMIATFAAGAAAVVQRPIPPWFLPEALLMPRNTPYSDTALRRDTPE